MLILIVVSAFSAGYIWNDHFNGINTIECDLGILQEQLQGYNEELVLISERLPEVQKQTEYDFLEELQRKFALSHNYTEGVYDCKHFSRDIKIVMNHLGYNVEVIGAYTGNNTGHAWNELVIEIEPQNPGKLGYFLTDKVRFEENQLKEVEKQAR